MPLPPPTSHHFKEARVPAAKEARAPAAEEARVPVAAERRLDLARPFKAGLKSSQTTPRRVSDA